MKHKKSMLALVAATVLSCHAHAHETALVPDRTSVAPPQMMSFEALDTRMPMPSLIPVTAELEECALRLIEVNPKRFKPRTESIHFEKLLHFRETMRMGAIDLKIQFASSADLDEGHRLDFLVELPDQEMLSGKRYGLGPDSPASINLEAMTDLFLSAWLPAKDRNKDTNRVDVALLNTGPFEASVVERDGKKKIQLSISIEQHADPFVEAQSVIRRIRELSIQP